MTSPDQSISGRRWRELLARQGRPWPVAIEDWERAARDTLDGGARGYVFGGAGSGSTRDANVKAFAQWRLAPHVLATPADRDLSVTLLDRILAQTSGVQAATSTQAIGSDADAASLSIVSGVNTMRSALRAAQVPATAATATSWCITTSW